MNSRGRARRPLVSPCRACCNRAPHRPTAECGPPHHTLLMPRKPIICTECGADRANKTWQQSGNQFAALLLVDDEAPPKQPRTPAADVFPARTKHDRDSKPSASKSSKDDSHCFSSGWLRRALWLAGSAGRLSAGCGAGSGRRGCGRGAGAGQRCVFKSVLNWENDAGRRRLAVARGAVEVRHRHRSDATPAAALGAAPRPCEPRRAHATRPMPARTPLPADDRTRACASPHTTLDRGHRDDTVFSDTLRARTKCSPRFTAK